MKIHLLLINLLSIVVCLIYYMGHTEGIRDFLLKNDLTIGLLAIFTYISGYYIFKPIIELFRFLIYRDME